MLSIAAAAMARDGDNRLKAVSLFTTQTDFHEGGELGLFIDESQITFLEDIMWRQGYLDSKQVSGAFQLLRSKDLIFSRDVQTYLLGKRREMTDLMAWNADSTRLPYRMHSEYLRKFFLKNELAEGHYEVGDIPIALTDIRAPIFAVATTKDHVAPWRSVYKIHLLVDTEVTFVLTTGGHNAGIISEPGHPSRTFQISTHTPDQKYVDADIWQQETPSQEGSWWLQWIDWLDKNSGKMQAPPSMGDTVAGYPPLDEAPGKHVLGM